MRVGGGMRHPTHDRDVCSASPPAENLSSPSTRSRSSPNQLRFFVCTNRTRQKKNTVPASWSRRAVRVLLAIRPKHKIARKTRPEVIALLRAFAKKSGWLFAFRFSDGRFHRIPDDFRLRHSQLLACIPERGDKLRLISH